MGRRTRAIVGTAVKAAAAVAVVGALGRRRSGKTTPAPVDAERHGRARHGGGDVQRGAEAQPDTGADVPDDRLLARVRAEVPIPDGVELAVVEGAVVLFGRLPPLAIDPLLQRVARVAGVSVVENRLTPARDLHHS